MQMCLYLKYFPRGKTKDVDFRTCYEDVFFRTLNVTISLNNQDYSRKKTLGLFLALCSKYSVVVASSVTNNSAEGSASELEWLPAAVVGGYWCAALLVLMVATCAARRLRRDDHSDSDSDEGADGLAKPERGLCERMAHCWPWSPHVAESPLASQIHLGRARHAHAQQSLRYEQLLEHNYVHNRAVPLGLGDEIGERVSLVEVEEQKGEKTGDAGHEELSSRGLEKLTTHGYAELASRGDKQLVSREVEELESRIHGELASDEREELASHGDEKLVSRAHVELASHGREGLPSSGYQVLALHEHVELTRGGLHELADDEREEVASDVVEEPVERVWTAPTRLNLHLQEASSEPLPTQRSEDALEVLEDTIIPVAVKPERSSPGHVSETETPTPLGSPDDRQVSAFASKQQSVTFSDKLRRFMSGADETSSRTRAAAGGKSGDQTPPCPLHSTGGPLSQRPSVKSLPSTRDGDVLDQEIEYSDTLCTCPPSKKESPRLVGVGSGSNQPALPTDEELQRQVEVARILSRYSSFVPDEEEKDAVPKDPLTIPKSWVPIQEQAAYARTSASQEDARLAENLSEIASRESRTTPERQRRDVDRGSSSRVVGQAASRRGKEQFVRDGGRFMRDEEQFISRRGVKRYRNERDDGYVTPVPHRKAHSRSHEMMHDSPYSIPQSRSVAAQTSPTPSPTPRRIVFSEVGTQVHHPEVHSVVLGSDSVEAFASTVNNPPLPSSRQTRSGSVVSHEIVKGGNRLPSSCFMHDIVPSLEPRKKRSLISIRSEDTETPGVQYWEEPKYTIAPAAVSVPHRDFLTSSNVTRHGEHPNRNFAAESESGLSTQWDLLHNFPSSPVDDDYVPYVTRKEGTDFICKTRPHSVCSTVTEQALPKGARPKFRPPAAASPESVELLYNRSEEHRLSDSVSGTATSDGEEYTVYLQCQCPDDARDQEQEKSFEADESLIYGVPPEWDRPPTERSAGSWRNTPDYQPGSPTAMEPPATHPMAQQRPTVAAHAQTGDQKTILHWKIVVHPQKGGDGKGSSDPVSERGSPQRGNQDSTPRQK